MAIKLRIFLLFFILFPLSNCKLYSEKEIELKIDAILKNNDINSRQFKVTPIELIVNGSKLEGVQKFVIDKNDKDSLIIYGLRFDNGEIRIFTNSKFDEHYNLENK